MERAIPYLLLAFPLWLMMESKFMDYLKLLETQPS
jgi:hypothetical protein